MGNLDSTYLDHLSCIQGIISYKLNNDYSSKEGRCADGEIELQTQTGSCRLAVQQYRSHLTLKTADHLVAQTKVQDCPLLLLAPSIGAPLGAKLADAGINYLDRAGNCHLACGGLYVHVEGRRAPEMPSSTRGLRSAGYQVLFCYLAQPELLNATVRAVAAAAGVSRQPVSATKRRLLDDEYIIQTKSAVRWVPHRRQEALSLWLHGYETTVRPSLIWGVYRTPDKSPVALEDRIRSTIEELDIQELRWGGTAAANRLTQYYRGEQTTVHLQAVSGDLTRRLRLLADPRGNLVLLKAPGTINWQPGSESVHPLLVYSEVLQEQGERAREAAQVLFEGHIQPLWDENP